MIHISHFSGGIGSWAATRRVADQHGTKDLHLVFADTLIEDDDLYRFLLDAFTDLYGYRSSACGMCDGNINLPDMIDDLPGRKEALKNLRELVNKEYPNVHWIADGRTPWEIFKDERFVGNSRIDPCSKILKREFIDRYCTEWFPEDAIHYFGIDWTEEHRIIRVRERMDGRRCEAPLCVPPLATKAELIKEAADAGIRPPRLYKIGFVHNNCGGFCVKSGQAQFALLLKTNPRLYAYHEQQEALMMEYLETSNATILKCRRNMKKGDKPRPLSLKAFRERLEKDPSEYDKFEWGGCACSL